MIASSTCRQLDIVGLFGALLKYDFAGNGWRHRRDRDLSRTGSFSSPPASGWYASV